MKSGKWLRALGLGCGLFAFSCGETDSGGSGGDIPLDSLPDELASAYCAIAMQCQKAFLKLAPAFDCKARLKQEFENSGFAAVRAAIEAGVVTYDPHLARECIDAFRAQGCNIYSSRDPEVCDRALSGDVALGSPCSINSECAGVAFCDKSADVCPGVCATRRPAGSSCEDSDECDDGLTCQGSVCAKPGLAGDACDGPNGPDCRSGLICVGASDTASGSCADTDSFLSGKLGDACNLASQELCDPELSCVLDGAALPLTFSCRAKSAAGAACARGFPEPCPDGYFCDAPATAPTMGLCKVLPKAGEACVTGDGRAAPCSGELACVSGICKERNANGAACTVDGECFSRCVNGTCTGDAFCTP